MLISISLVNTINVVKTLFLLIGYALNKVIKILSIVVGLFLTGLAYLQSQKIAKINWNCYLLWIKQNKEEENNFNED